MADGEKLYKTIRQKYTNIINAAVEKCKGFGENAVAGGRGQSPGGQAPQPEFHVPAVQRGKLPVAEGGGKVLPGYAFVHCPASLAQPDMRQIDFGNEGIKRRNVFSFHSPVLPFQGQHAAGKEGQTTAEHGFSCWKG